MCVLFGMVLAMALVGCSMDGGGGGGGPYTPLEHTLIADDVVIKITETNTQPDVRAAISPARGNYYWVFLSGSLINKGTITGNGTIITFSGNFTLTLNGSVYILTGSIPNSQGGSVSGPIIFTGSTSGGTYPQPSQLATQLAVDLNAILAGSATAEGATVKLTGTAGYLCIPSALTVPAGVTLDVTAGGSSLILGSQSVGNTPVTLTVNGTVIAGPNHVRLEDCQRGAATINGSGIIRLKGNGHLLYVQGNWNTVTRKIILDGVTLVGLEGNDEALVYVDKGGVVEMKSGAIMGNGDWGVAIQEGGTTTKPPSGDIYTFVGGTFTMEGGTISGNSGGGVLIYTAGAGGDYQYTTVEGGLVNVINDISKGAATFNLNSPATIASIYGNTGSQVRVEGGGIFKVNGNSASGY